MEEYPCLQSTPEPLGWDTIALYKPRGEDHLSADATFRLNSRLHPGSLNLCSAVAPCGHLSRTGDATGVVVAHAIGGKQVERFDAQMKRVYEWKPIIRVDLAPRVVPPRGGEIDIPTVRSLIYRLHDLGAEYGHQGLQFGLVTFDTFGSQESVKALNDAGYTSDV